MCRSRWCKWIAPNLWRSIKVQPAQCSQPSAAQPSAAQPSAAQPSAPSAMHVAEHAGYRACCRAIVTRELNDGSDCCCVGSASSAEALHRQHPASSRHSSQIESLWKRRIASESSDTSRRPEQHGTSSKHQYNSGQHAAKLP